MTSQHSLKANEAQLASLAWRRRIVKNGHHTSPQGGGFDVVKFLFCLTNSPQNTNVFKSNLQFTEKSNDSLFQQRKQLVD